jgi:hypothetical protein
MDPVTVPLEEPVTIGSGKAEKTYTEIVFTHKAKGRDLAAGDLVKGNTNRAYAIYASMAGVPITVFQEMAADDLAEVMNAGAPLLGKAAQRKLKELAAMEDEEDEETS